MTKPFAAAALAGAALAGAILGGCSRAQRSDDQNVVITENIPANADVEALPPDESAPAVDSSTGNAGRASVPASDGSNIEVNAN